ncbi:MAG: hypothetical protein P8O14_02240 [SAR86 cluster bacterium]|nr:hypothetical protein [SAR86 cluster bacterium]
MQTYKVVEIDIDFVSDKGDSKFNIYGGWYEQGIGYWGFRIYRNALHSATH